MLAAEHFEERTSPLHIGFAAADHDAERRGLGPIGSAADGAVEVADPDVGKAGGDHRAVAGSMVAKSRQSSPRRPAAAAPSAPRKRFHRMLGRHSTRAQHVDRRRELAGRTEHFCAFLPQCLDSVGAMTVDGELVAGAEQVARHRQPHQPQPDEADFHPCPFSMAKRFMIQ